MPVLLESDQASAAAHAALLPDGAEIVDSTEALEKRLHSRPDEYAVVVGPETSLREAGLIAVRFVGAEGALGVPHQLISDWKPGEAVWQGAVDGQTVAMQVRPISNGFRLAHQGYEVAVSVFTESEAAAARLMPVGAKADTGKKLLCPMPGLVVSIAVAEGQEVKAGETLAVVEAMKMQNVLRAERDGTVKKIHATAGATLAVDALILEFA